MHASWIISPDTLAKAQQLLEKNQHKELVIRRREKNLTRQEVDISRQAIWRVMVGCQVTTQQRSGPETKVGRFMNELNPTSSGALSYKTCRDHANPQQFIESELRAAQLWRAKPIAKSLATILVNLEAGEWETLTTKLSTLRRNTTRKKERAVANYLQSKSYPGLGPKQSRNLIQWLGLSRYEVPIDSRVIKLLKKWKANVTPKANALSDESVYVFVQSALQDLAAQLDTYPCMLDAAIFASFDNK